MKHIRQFLRTGCEDREYSFAEGFVCFFSSFFCGKKFVIWGKNIFSQIRLKKQMGHPGREYPLVRSSWTLTACDILI